jgi:phosphoribosylformylglycinamidine (FGAM) synthase-like amidotransferase family enzyme
MEGGKIYYINGSLLKAGEIERTVNKWWNTQGLIVDLRNYPSKEIAFKLAEYLIPTKKEFFIASIPNREVPGEFYYTVPYVSGKPDETDNRTLKDGVYKGKLVIIINERTISRDGLIIGICNGFQALIKLGLVPFGEITEIMEDYPTLTYNKIGRHVSTFVKTKVVSNLSPWLAGCRVGDIHYLPVSHGEGSFAASEKWIKTLKDRGQIATQYVDTEDLPTYDGFYNPNGSLEAVEGITSPDGRVFGKMAHSERLQENIYKNISGYKDQLLFESGVKYFK